MDTSILDNLFSNYDKVDENMRSVTSTIVTALNKSGLMFRIFSRVKGQQSVYEKISQKEQKYARIGRGMQDLIGIRIVLYFEEDIDICIRLLGELFVIDSCEHDEPDSETFKPIRINYVYRVPDELFDYSKCVKHNYLLDNTFEVQIRTVLSEGWHEVEHDIKYKNKPDWEDETEMARDLNAILAVLEMCDNNIVGICDNLAYNKYKKQDFSAMLRCRYRMRFLHGSLSQSINDVLLKNSDKISKKIFRFSKARLVQLFLKTGAELTLDNAIRLINLDSVHDEEIERLTNEQMIEAFHDLEDEPWDDSVKTYNSIVSMKFR